MGGGDHAPASGHRRPPGPGPTALTDGEEDVPQNGQSSELMQRLIAEEQRLAIEAQLRWIVYARSEIRSLAANADGRR